MIPSGGGVRPEELQLLHEGHHGAGFGGREVRGARGQRSAGQGGAWVGTSVSPSWVMSLTRPLVSHFIPVCVIALVQNQSVLNQFLNKQIKTPLVQFIPNRLANN